MDPVAQFFAEAEKNVFNESHRSKLQFNIAQYEKKVVQGKMQYSNLELAKTRASGLRNKTTEHLDKYLIEFEANFIKRGGKIIWAQDAVEAQNEISSLLKKKNMEERRVG